MRRLIDATLLLYPRAVRRHGEELESLVEALIEHDGRSRPAVMTRLALDGLIQRLTSRGTAWVVAVTVAVMSFGGLAVSDFSAASAHGRPAHRTHVAAQAARRDSAGARRTHRAHRTRTRSAGIIDR